MEYQLVFPPRSPLFSQHGSLKWRLNLSLSKPLNFEPRKALPPFPFRRGGGVTLGSEEGG